MLAELYMCTCITVCVSTCLQAQHERELKQLKTELLDMKKQRVKMLNKMRTESSKFVSLWIVDLHVGVGHGKAII